MFFRTWSIISIDPTDFQQYPNVLLETKVTFYNEVEREGLISCDTNNKHKQAK